MGTRQSIIGLFVIFGALMLITGKPGIIIEGYPLGLLVFGLGVAGWAPFYGLSLLRNVVSFIEEYPVVATIAALMVAYALYQGGIGGIPI